MTFGRFVFIVVLNETTFGHTAHYHELRIFSFALFQLLQTNAKIEANDMTERRMARIQSEHSDSTYSKPLHIFIFKSKNSPYLVSPSNWANCVYTRACARAPVVQKVCANKATFPAWCRAMKIMYHNAIQFNFQQQQRRQKKKTGAY